MIRTILLLVATLAALTLAVPAPSYHRSSGRRLGSKHSFKSSTRGHRGHNNPRTELARVYNKFHWSISLPLLGETLTISIPSTDGSNESSSSDGEYGSSDDYGLSDGYGSSEGSDLSSTTIVSPQPTSSPNDSQPTSFRTSTLTSVATDAPESANVYPVPSSERIESASVSASASASATGSSSGAANDTGEVEAQPEPNESEYLSPVTIGGQEFNLNFDTGSADL